MLNPKHKGTVLLCEDNNTIEPSPCVAQQDPAEDGYNWYIYGNQNPVMFADYTGLDAIILTNEYAVNSGEYTKGIIGNDIYFGHQAVLIQDSTGQWHYFSCGKGYVVFTPVDENSMKNLKTLSESYYWPNMYYTDSTYIKGDFTKSYSFFDNYNEKNSPNNKRYNFLLNNCTNVVLLGISYGILQDGTSVKQYIGTNSSFIPNINKDKMKEVFYKGNTRGRFSCAKTTTR